jgi:hypothetical protein
MGYPVKLQKVDRPTNRSYYVNIPVPMAESLVLEKGEPMEWLVEDENTLVLRRITKRQSILHSHGEKRA